MGAVSNCGSNNCNHTLKNRNKTESKCTHSQEKNEQFKKTVTQMLENEKNLNWKISTLFIFTYLCVYIHKKIHQAFVCSKDWLFFGCCCRAVWMSACACILVFEILWINLKNATAARKFTVTVMRNTNSNMQFSTHRRSLYRLLGLCLLLFETGKLVFECILKTKSNDLRHKLVAKKSCILKTLGDYQVKRN